MGAELMNMQSPTPNGIMGPSPQAVATNAPTPEMQNLARGQDPMANGLGDIRPSLPGMPAGPGKSSRGKPPPPQMPGSLDAGTPAGGDMKTQLAMALMKLGAGRNRRIA